MKTLLFSVCRDAEGLWVVVVSNEAHCIDGPHEAIDDAWVAAERLARRSADYHDTQWVYAVWPEEFQANHREYVDQLGTEFLARACYIVRWQDETA